MFLIRSDWTGFVGGPGYTTFAFTRPDGQPASPADVDVAATNVKYLWDHINFGLPSSVTIQVQQTAKVVTPTTGQLTSLISGTVVQAPTKGAGGIDSYSGASGAVLEWVTSTLAGNRLVRGRTFIVPLISSAYDNGSLLPTFYGPLATNAATMYTQLAGTGISFGIWARPAKARVNRKGVAFPAHPGAYAPVTGSRVPDLAAILRTRRD